jgi:AcrR family transcriptional regulator
MTTGILLHYFRNKDALMVFALEQSMGDPSESVSAIRLPVGFERLQAMLEYMLPLKTKRQIGWRVWVACLGYVISRPALMKFEKDRYSVFRENLKLELSATIEAKRITKAIDLEDIATGIVAFVDGVGVGYVLDAKQYPAKRQKTLAANHIDQLRVRATR